MLELVSTKTSSPNTLSAKHEGTQPLSRYG